MAIARISSPRTQTTLQDAGRPGLRHLGVPLSGAADRLSLAIANSAIGNRWDAPALECTLTGPALAFERATTIAIAGADMSPALNNASIAQNTPISIKPGDRLRLGTSTNGLRCYIAIAGGIAGKDFLGSVSTYEPALIGGLKGRSLREGDLIESASHSIGTAATLPPQLHPVPKENVILRATRGPEWSFYDDNMKADFFSSPFEVTRRGNRMGAELQGPFITPPQDFSMISSPVFPGTVQTPPAGQPFLLLNDAQTVGGYARIAQVIDADLHLTGQLRPGTKIWFSELSPEAARDVTAKKTALYDAWLPGFSFA